MKRLASVVSLLVALMLVASACTSEETPEETSDDSSESSSGGESSEAAPAGDVEDCQEGTLTISGSSTVEPVTASVADKYVAACGDGAEITVDGPGTSDGFDLFCQGQIDINDASRAIKEEEAAECADAGVDVLELKIALDGIAVMTNPANEIECVSFVDLYALLGDQSENFEKWSDADALGAELGSDLAPYPDADLEISAPGTESGTYASMIEIVLEEVVEEAGGNEDSPIRTDYSGQADDNLIIEGITGSESSLGWVGFAFAQANADAVKILEVSAEPGGDCVSPTPETINDNSYPVSRALYIYVDKAKMADNPLLGSFVDYYLNDAYSDSVVNAFDEGQGYIELAEIEETRSQWEAAK